MMNESTEERRERREEMYNLIQPMHLGDRVLVEWIGEWILYEFEILEFNKDRTLFKAKCNTREEKIDWYDRYDYEVKEILSNLQAGTISFLGQDIAKIKSIKIDGPIPNAVKKETVDHPDHYGGEDNPYEVIKVIEAWGLGFCLGNTIKYIARAGKKGDELEDLRKAQWYLDRAISTLKEEEE